jgi:hypothetical protein
MNEKISQADYKKQIADFLKNGKYDKVADAFLRLAQKVTELENKVNSISTETEAVLADYNARGTTIATLTTVVGEQQQQLATKDQTIATLTAANTALQTQVNNAGADTLDDSVATQVESAFDALSEPTTTTLVADASLSAVGSPGNLTATVEPATPSSSSLAPTGIVTFNDGSTLLGTAPVGSGSAAVLNLSAGLAAGPHSITATYTGDTANAASTSPGVSVSTS